MNGYRRNLLVPILECFTLIFLQFSLVPIRAAASDDFDADMVEVVAKFPTATFDSIRGEQRGFGLIMLEKNNYLYVATPRHVVTNRDTQKSAPLITAMLYDHGFMRTTQAELLQKSSSMDLALIKLKKPEGFSWKDGRYGSVASSGNNVRIYDASWWKREKGYLSAVVTSVSPFDLTIAATVKEGDSGGLVVTQDSVVGILLESNDDKDRVTALRFDIINQIVLGQWLNEELKPEGYEASYPYVVPGAGLTLMVPLTSINERLPPFAYGGGLTLDFIASRDWGIRYAHNQYLVAAKMEWPISNESINFRNNISVDMLELLWNPSGSDASYLREMYGTVYLYAGYGVGHHEPEVNVNGSGWTQLSAEPSFTGDYSKTFNVLSLGVAANKPFSGSNWSIGFNFELMFTDNKYIAVDILKPFDDNAVNDFFAAMNVNLTYSFGKPYMQRKKGLFMM